MLNSPDCAVHGVPCFSSHVPLQGPRPDADKGSTVIEVVIATYHQDHVLKTLINSVKAQTLPANVADGSHTDNFGNYDEYFHEYPHWKLHLIHDGNDDFYRRMRDDLEANGYLDDRITYTCSEERCDDGYGHGNRHHGLVNLVSDESDYVIVANGDTYFVPVLFRWIDSISRTDNPDFIYWDIAHRQIQNSPNVGGMSSHIMPDHIDWTSAAIRTSIAKSVGITSKALNADWHYFNDALAFEPHPTISTYKLGKIMAVHN